MRRASIRVSPRTAATQLRALPAHHTKFTFSDSSSEPFGDDVDAIACSPPNRQRKERDKDCFVGVDLRFGSDRGKRAEGGSEDPVSRLRAALRADELEEPLLDSGKV